MRQLLPFFQKPSHYAGVEDGVCLKTPQDIALRVALAFPDAYEVGMSYLGHKILYGIINDVPQWQAERVMAPDLEAGKLLAETHTPLASIESGTPLGDFAAIGFAITHELCFADVLRMLKLANLPLLHEERPEDLKSCPLIMAGGGAMLGAEPISPFLDLVLLGDGEELVPEVLRLLEKARAEGVPRSEFLRQASNIPGAYVPSLFSQNGDGSLSPAATGLRPKRRVVADLEKAHYPARQISPVGAVHNRLSLEIARGCQRGCRFCHAGMVYRPYRERGPEQLEVLLNDCLDKTGFEEVSFLSLSAGDYSDLGQLWESAYARCAKEQISMALPSLRVGSVASEIMAKMASLRRTGVTLAPEAGSQRLRDVINKGITEEALLSHARMLLEQGWRQVKLYFMIGLPTETDEDLKAILDLCRKTRDAGGKGSPRLGVTCSISPFVPKPFTPFQWEDQTGLEEIRRKIGVLLSLFRNEKLLTLRWHDPEASFLEGIFSRGDRRLASVIEKAVQKGAAFCSWKEHFSLEPWLEALAEEGIDPEDLLKGRQPGSRLPWSHLEAGVSEEFLLAERAKAYAEKTTADCRVGGCQKCGACDRPGSPSLLSHEGSEPLALKIAWRKPREEQTAPASPGVPVGPPKGRKLPLPNPALALRHSTYRVWHVKRDGFAYLSQLELQTVVARVLRRAKLPVAFSQGFHPMPLLSFGKALPVGVQSMAEWFSVTLHSYLAPQKVLAGLNLFLQPGLGAFHVELVERKKSTAQALAEEFLLQFNDEFAAERAEAAFDTFSQQDEYIHERLTKKGLKSENIRPFLQSWRKTEDGIAFLADWSEGYLSPLKLASAILKLEGLDLAANGKMIKTLQIFENGQRYPA